MSKPKVRPRKTEIKLRSGHKPEPKPSASVTLLVWSNDKIVVRYLNATPDEVEKEVAKIVKKLYPEFDSPYDVGEWQILNGYVPLRVNSEDIGK